MEPSQKLIKNTFVRNSLHLAIAFLLALAIAKFAWMLFAGNSGIDTHFHDIYFKGESWNNYLPCIFFIAVVTQLINEGFHRYRRSVPGIILMLTGLAFNVSVFGIRYDWGYTTFLPLSTNSNAGVFDSVSLFLFLLKAVFIVQTIINCSLIYVAYRLGVNRKIKQVIN